MNPLIRSSFCLRRIVVLFAALFVTVVSAHAQTLTVLHTFTSRPDGLTPIGGVIMMGSADCLAQPHKAAPVRREPFS